MRRTSLILVAAAVAIGIITPVLFLPPVSGDAHGGMNLSGAGRFRPARPALIVSLPLPGMSPSASATGAGKDEFVNTGTIADTRTANADNTAFRDVLDGHRKVDGATSAVSTAAGYDTENGKDRLTNRGTIQGSATSTARDVTIDLIAHDAVRVDASVIADAAAAGVSGGRAADEIRNEGGTVEATATAEASVVSVDLSLLELASVGADVKAVAAATGIGGGVQDDLIVNEGTVRATARADADIYAFDLALVDAARATAVDNAVAIATSLAGGAGNDNVTNRGTVAAEATARGRTIKGSVNVFDVTILPQLLNPGSGTSVHTAATALGITGGDGDDQISSSGTMTVNASSDALSVDISVGVGGVPDGILSAFEPDPLADIGVNARADATGIDGGEGTDTVVHGGTATVTTTSSATSIGVGVGFPLFEILERNIKTPSALNFLDLNVSEAGAGATAGAAGIDGGAGRGSLINTGTLTVGSDAFANSVAVKFNIPGLVSDDAENEKLTIGVDLVTAATVSDARAGGILGGTQEDLIGNAGTLDVRSSAESYGTSVAVSLQDDIEGLGIDFVRTDTSVAATADTRGIDGGEGANAVRNDNAVTAVAEALANSVGASIAVAGSVKKGAGIGVAFADTSTTSTATAAGVTAGAAADNVVSAAGSTLSVLADAQGYAETISVQVTGSGKGVEVGGAVVLAGDNVAAAATGTAAGDGTNAVYRAGLDDVTASATANNLAVAVEVAGEVKGVGINGAFADTSTTSTATAAGVTAGAAADNVVSAAGSTLSVLADAQGYAETISVQVTGSGKGVEVGGAVALAGVDVAAAATGTAAGDGTNAVYRAGLDNVTASATANNLAVSVGVAGEVKGVGIGGAFADTSTTGTATAAGVATGAAADTVVSAAGSALHVLADTATYSQTIAVEIQGTGTGLVVGGAVGIGTTMATATASGVASGAGGDALRDVGWSEVSANALSSTVGVSLGIQGTVTGLGIGGAVSDMTATATAASAGLSAGAGADNVTLGPGGTLKVVADAEALATTVAVEIQGPATGVSIGGAVALGGTTGTATATGVDAGDGHDTVRNEGWTEARAEADSDAVSVAVGIQGGVTGAGLQAALSDTSSTALATSSGIQGGGGDDTVLQSETVLAGARADVDATAVSVEVTIASTGAAIGASLARSAGNATSVAHGVDAGDGADVVSNIRTIGATSEAFIDAVSVGVSVSGSLEGGAGGAALTDSSAIANAESAAIAAGAGDDVVTNGMWLASSARFEIDTTSVSVAVSGALGLAGGAALSDSSAEGNATAIGIDGGIGRDNVTNAGLVGTTASATADATSVSVNVTGGIVAGGAAISDSSVTIGSHATGIAGGGDEDAIANTGIVLAGASADGEAASVSVNVGMFGASLGDASTDATVSAAGIDSGTEDDRLRNDGFVGAYVASRIEADSTAINIGLGWAGATVNVTSNATAAGLVGGTGNDKIVNTGRVLAGPDNTTDPWMASLRAESFSLGLGGVTEAESSFTARTRSTGIDGGEGDDLVDNRGDVSAAATTYSDVSASTISIFGTAEAGGTSEATTEATGISGGTGNDAILHTGTLDAFAASSLSMDGSTFTFGGTGKAGGRLTATTRAAGIAGGGGMDRIASGGRITVLDNASLASTGESDAGFGATDAEATVGADTVAAGIDGGEGDDAIANTAAIDVTASSAVAMDSSSFTFGGTGKAGGRLTAATRAVGIEGGDGTDNVVNTGNLAIDAASSLASTGDSDGAFGTTDAGATVGAVTDAAGIDGGDGDDAVDSGGNVDVKASSSVTLDASSYTFGGTGEAGGILGAATRAAGIAGGAGADRLVVSGTLSIDASSSLTSRNDSETTFGTSDGGSAAGARTEAAGIDGGDGDDRVENAASLEVTAGSSVSMDGSNYTFGGTGAAADSLSSATEAAGIAGGAGADTLLNRGRMVVRAASALAISGKSETTFGTSKAGAYSTAEVSAAGIDGGEGGDVIESSAAIDVLARSEGTSDKSAYVFGGDPSGTTVMSSNAASAGIAGGGGDDVVRNEAGILSEAVSSLTGIGESKSSFGGTANSVARTTAIAQGAGILGGSGNDNLVNLAPVRAGAFADAHTSVDGDPGWLWGKGNSNAFAEAVAGGAGIDAGPGHNDIINTDNLAVAVTAHADSYATASGAFFNGDATCYAKATASAAATGIASGGGNDRIVNAGTIDAATAKSVVETPGSDPVLLRTTAQAETWSNGQGADGDGRSGWGKGVNEGPIRAIAEAEAAGISSGDGNDVVLNAGTISVRADGFAEVDAITDGDAFADADGFGWATSAARAFGIRTGDGHSRVVNTGAISSRATPGSDSFTSESRDCCGGDNEGTDWVEADALAVGIRTGTGNSRIENHGEIAAEASPAAAALDRGDGGPELYYSVASRAIGILAGDGGQEVINSGTIDAAASYAPGVAAGDVAAYGIRTGAGDDLIVNGGSITARIVQGNVTIPGVGIDSGSGNDNVVLGDGAAVQGHVDLGPGDDALTVRGVATVTGDVRGNAGTDTLVLSEGGDLTAWSMDLENLVKVGQGTFSLRLTGSLPRIELAGGTLALGSSYAFAPDGVLVAVACRDGVPCGMEVRGTATLGGDLAVVRGKEVYSRSGRGDLIRAEALEGDFAAVALPPPTPLLSFDLRRTGTGIAIETTVRPFATVASNPVESAVARHLDVIAPVVGGDLAAVLGEIQALAPPQYADAFGSLSPAVYDGDTAATRGLMRTYVGSLTHRMDQVRAKALSPAAGSAQRRGPAGRENRLAYGGAGTRAAAIAAAAPAGAPGSRYGGWLNVFGQFADQDPDPGYDGFDYAVSGTSLGLDRFFGGQAVAGLGLGFAGSRIDQDGDAGEGSIDSLLASAYGSRFGKRWYVEGALAYGHHRYENDRLVSIGSIERIASSSHGGDSFSAYAGAGIDLPLGGLILTPRGALRYDHLDEDGFRETGADNASLIVACRTTDGLASELGLRLSRFLPAGGGTLLPEVGLAWGYDFDVDDPLYTAALAGAPSVSFVVPGQETGRNAALFDAALTYVDDGGFAASLRYGAEWRESYGAHAFMGEIRLGF